MNLPRATLALLMSILMGTPLCCCAVETEEANAGQPSSCCHAAQSSGDAQEQPGDHICACRSKEPREAAKELQLTGNQVTEPYLGVVEFLDPLVAEPVVVITGRADHSGGDPPTRLRLARLSRWLN